METVIAGGHGEIKLFSCLITEALGFLQRHKQKGLSVLSELSSICIHTEYQSKRTGLGLHSLVRGNIRTDIHDLRCLINFIQANG